MTASHPATVDGRNLQAISDNATVALFIMDERQHCTFMNPAAEALIGYKLSEVTGRTLHDVVHHTRPDGTPYPIDECPIDRAFPENMREQGEDVFVHPDGHFYPVSFTASPISEGDRVVGTVIEVRDLSLEHAATEALKEDARLVETLQRIGQTLTSETDVQRIVQVVTDAATQLSGAQFGAFFYNVENENGESYTLYTISGVPREAFDRFPMPRNTAVFGPTFHGTGTIRSADITADPRYGKNPPYHGMPEGHLPVRSYLAVPVISKTGDVLGGLFFGHADTDVFSERDERLVNGIAAWAAVAMDNARLLEAEHRARADAERANRVKSEFLATMSHELRTPLNAMMGYSDLLLAGIPEPLPPLASQKVERINISARHLLDQIEQMLTFTRLDADSAIPRIQPVALRAILDTVEALTAFDAAAKGLRLDWDMPDTQIMMNTDARMVRQLLLNVIANAVKFTDEGSVRVSTELVGSDVHIAVEDTGPGIEPEHLEQIFQAFWQVDRGHTRSQDGAGLGLAVARRLARLLGGDIEVRSSPGSGSTFSIRLPLRSPSAT